MQPARVPLSCRSAGANRARIRASDRPPVYLSACLTGAAAAHWGPLWVLLGVRSAGANRAPGFASDRAAGFVRAQVRAAGYERSSRPWTGGPMVHGRRFPWVRCSGRTCRRPAPWRRCLTCSGCRPSWPARTWGGGVSISATRGRETEPSAGFLCAQISGWGGLGRAGPYERVLPPPFGTRVMRDPDSRVPRGAEFWGTRPGRGTDAGRPPMSVQPWTIGVAHMTESRFSFKSVNEPDLDSAPSPSRGRFQRCRDRA